MAEFEPLPKGKPGHLISERRAPALILIKCSCGWNYCESRRQNALARHAKIRAAIRRHLKEAGVE